MPEPAETTENFQQHDIVSVLRGSEMPPPEMRADLSTSIDRIAQELSLDKKTAQTLRALADIPSVNILKDVPSENDSFGFAPLVRTLSDVVLSDSTQTPLTIAVDGEWGSGKSSVMKMVEHQAQLVGFPCIWLNAWSLENTEQLIKESKFRIQDEIKNRHTKSAFGKSVFGVWFRKLRSLMQETGTPDEVVKGVEKGVEEVASWARAYKSFHQLVKILLDSAVEVEPQEISDKPRQDQSTRLIVFVDDIDRALPDQVAATFRTLKIILESPHCVFVLGMDMGMVARSIEAYYRDHTRRLFPEGSPAAWPYQSPTIDPEVEEVVPRVVGRSYLEKIVQIHLKVPRLTREIAMRYLRELQVAKEVIPIIRWAPDGDLLNPRRLKRYVNWLSIALQFIVSSNLPDGISNLKALRYLAMRRDYPKIYGSLLKGVDSRSSLISDVLFSHYRVEAGQRSDLFSEFVEYCSKHFLPADVQSFEEFLPSSPLLGSLTEASREGLNV